MMTASLIVVFAWGHGAWSPQNAGEWRARAEASVRSRDFQRAAEAYRKSADVFRRLGEETTVQALEQMARRYETRIGLYFEGPPPSSSTLGRFEPASGLYLGAYIQGELEIKTRVSGHPDPRAFASFAGKKHAIFMDYHRYGRAFPKGYAAVLRDRGAALHLALEPHDLDAVADNAYLRQFVADMRGAEIPIFLRFASEMNGSWVPWHGNPTKYKEKFRIVSRVVRETAPNVAMVWCPYDLPEETIEAYYPGAEYVDWVGVNFYAVTFFNGDRNRPADWRQASDSLRFIYDKYAARHPILVGEWAATHMSKVDMKPVPDWAAARIREFYQSVPRFFPRVKAVNWFSLNTFERAVAPRRLNNFSLIESEPVLREYARSIQDRYYLSDIVQDHRAGASFAYLPADRIDVKSGTVRLSYAIKTPYEDATVIVRDGANTIWSTSANQLGSKNYRPAGPTTLTIEVRAEGKSVTSKTYTIKG